VGFGFAANLAADKFSLNFQYKTANIKLKANKFKAYVFEAN